MSIQRSVYSSVYIGPIAVGYLPKSTTGEWEEQLDQRLWCPLQDDATHHWVPKVPCSSPTLSALSRYSDGATGSFVVETSSETEIAHFEADFGSEIETLKTKYEKLEIVFGVISY